MSGIRVVNGSLRTRRTIRRPAARLTVGCLVVLVAGCGTATSGAAARGVSPSTTTLMAGWQQKFELDWQAKPGPDGTQRIQGYIVSRHGHSAEPVRVLVQVLDASGAAMDYRIAWIPGGVPGFGRAYFEVAHQPSSSAMSHQRIV